MKRFREAILENDEAMARKGYATHIPHKSDGTTFVISHKKPKRAGDDQFHMSVKDSNGKVAKDWGSHPSHSGAKKFAARRGYVSEATGVDQEQHNTKDIVSMVPVK